MISHDPMTLELLVRPSLPRSGLGFDIYRGFSFIPLRSLSLNSFILIYTVIKREPVKISTIEKEVIDYGLTLEEVRWVWAKYINDHLFSTLQGGAGQAT